MRSRIHFEAAVLALAVGSRCGGGGDVEVKLMFQLEERLVQLQLDVYEDPPDDLCNLGPMQSPGPWPTVTASPYMTQAVVYGSNDLDLNPGTWGFVFRGGDLASGYEIGVKDIARGCAIASLGSGVNPPVTIEIYEIFWPGECGDGNLDPEENCDDGNTDPPSATDHCAADCLSTPIVKLNDVDESRAQYEPDATYYDGGYYIAYTSESRGDPFLETSINVFGKKLDRHLAAVFIGTYHSVRLHNNEAGPQSQPSVAAAGNTLASVWLDTHPTLTVVGDIRYRSIDTTTGGWPAEVFLNTVTANPQNNSVIGGNGSSRNLITAWTTDASDDDVLCRRIVDLAPETAAETSCASSTTGNQDQPSAAMAPDGTYAVAWRAAGNGVYVRFFDADGAALTGDLQVSPSGDRPSIEFDSGGRLMAAWREADVIRGRIYDATGAPAGEAFDVGWGATTADNRGVVDVTAGLGRDGPVFLVVWVAPIVGIRARLVTGTGTFGINRFVSSDPGNVPFEDTGEFSVTPSAYEGIQTARAAAAPDGEALVVWEDRSAGNRDIQGRIVPTN